MGSIGDDEPGEQMEINTVIPLNDKKETMETFPNENSYMTKPGYKEEEQNGGGEEGRETWSKKVDFLLSVIGFAVDLANVWRFPYLCYKNGGGAFLIPYLVMLLVGGIPLFYMELALGQFNRTGAITCWGRLCPLFKGIGWAVVLIAFYTDFFYNVVIAWCLHFFISSFSSPLPWVGCDNPWNTKYCYDGTQVVNGSINGTFGNFTDMGNFTNGTMRVSAAAEYFERGMLEVHESSGLYDVGGLKWQLVLCLLGVYLICYFSLWKGIHTSGKVVWFTALFPYVVLFILLCRGATLDGAALGIEYYLTPNFNRLLLSEVWVDAATQVYFSLGPGFGVLLAYASYNPLNNNVYRDAIMTSAINCLTSFFSGFVIFMILGYMSVKSGLDIDKVATEGPGLVFIVYPEAIATLPGAPYWAIIFFLMLLTLGLDSSFGGSEAIITALGDEFPVLKKHRELFVAALFSVYFLFGLASVAQGGVYVVTLMERFAAGYSILFAVFFEAVVVSWAYGVNKFSEDIECMIGSKPGKYWTICWSVLAPVFLMSIMIFGLVNYTPLQYEDYVYPLSATLIGWAIALSSILCIPGFAVWGILRAKGSLTQRISFLLTPQNSRESKIRNSINTIKVTENNVGDHV